MIATLLATATRVFDRLESWWFTVATQKRIASGLTLVFLAGLLVVEARRRGWLPEGLAEYVPTKHYYAILVAFTLLLLAEVVELVFALAQSVANAVGKQLEIMSLILIRQSFKELTYFDEPIVWGEMTGEVTSRVVYILSDALGALIIFALLAVYYRLQHHQAITRDADEQANFVAGKKLIALLLLIGLIVIGVDWTLSAVAGTTSHGFFEVFYTLLIFADVLIVLISMRYNTPYPVVFRYFGFAVATVLVRLALTAPRIIDAALGVGATLFAIALTWAYNRSGSAFEEAETVGPE
jgi:hypothetical protein